MAERVEMTVRCPICHVDIPAPEMEVPTADGLSTTFDITYIDEHVTMHAACTCEWDDLKNANDEIVTTIRTLTDDDCPIHGGHQ